jgi:hypothetical protein
VFVMCVSYYERKCLLCVGCEYCVSQIKRERVLCVRHSLREKVCTGN